MQRYPEVTLHIHQGNPTQVAEQVASGEADIGIATEAISTYDQLLCLPCYQWNRCVITPPDHPLLSDLPLTLEKITRIKNYIKFGHDLLKQGHSDYDVIRFYHSVANNDL